jgi:hypothetical protein
MSRPMINQEIVKLVEDVQYGIGAINDSARRHTEPYDFDGIDNGKIKCKAPNSAMPGARIEIHWDYGEYQIVDTGYIFTLPGFDSGDIWMSGIVHIPEPMGCDKSDCDPEWIDINRLLEDENVSKVIIG